MTPSIRLRPWQKAALDKLLAHEGPDFLAVATPGAGKTTFALTAARHLLAEQPRRLIVVAPTAHLKVQWAQAAMRFALHLDPVWSAADGRLPGDMHGIVTTYQQVASSADVLAQTAAGAIVIFDEIHHAGDDRAWGSSVREAFDGASRRLSLSGTPFRSDTQAIPFVRYVLDEAAPDYEYGYGEALADGRVVRPVYFPRTGGLMEWTAPDGTLNEASFDDALDSARSSQRLRTALSIEGEWLPTVLRAAADQLQAIRTAPLDKGGQPDAGGLVIATDQDHARAISALLRDRFGARSTVVTSDDPDASDRIAAFARNLDPWLVAVRMVSEGVDIPRLRVGVYATTTTTELFFRQAVGRLVRWVPGVRNQKSYLFIPDDARLRARAFQIADLRRHSLAKRASEWAERDPAELDQQGEEQLSLFAALSAVATGHEIGEGIDPPFDGDDVDGDLGLPDDPSLLLSLAPPPPLDGVVGGDPGDSGAPVLTRREEKQRLRERNADIVAALVRRTGRTHPQVNAELNRLSGVGRVTEATSAQLAKRLAAGEKLLRNS